MTITGYESYSLTPDQVDRLRRSYFWDSLEYPELVLVGLFVSPFSMPHSVFVDALTDFFQRDMIPQSDFTVDGFVSMRKQFHECYKDTSSIGYYIDHISQTLDRVINYHDYYTPRHL